MKKLLFFLATVLSATLSAQTKADYIFFKGDTLVGFDINGAISEATAKLNLPNEQKVYVKLKENAFVKSKYHLTKLPFEPNTQTQSRIIMGGNIPAPMSTSCNNADFATGDFTNWTGGIGYNPNTDANLVVTAAGIVNVGGDNVALNSCSYHTIMSAAGGTDYYGGFAVIPPNGGSFACRLGGDAINTYGAGTCTVTNDPTNSASSNGETIHITIPVTQANFLLTYNYAVVLSNAGHLGGENPYFSVQLLGQTGSEITCNTYIVESDTTGSGATPPSWFKSAKTDRNNPGSPVIYSGWVSNSINLEPYLGQTVTIKFTAAGCIYGGHFGYGYLTCSCGTLALNSPANNLCGQQTIVAPANAGGTYLWAGPGIVGGANTQSVSCNQPGSYTVTITNQQGCSYKIDTTITALGNISLVSSKSNICSGATTTLTASGGISYTWSTGATTSSIVVSPTVTTTYSVTGTAVNNYTCTNTATSIVTPVAIPTSPSICVVSTDSTTNYKYNIVYWNNTYNYADSFIVCRYSPVSNGYLRIGAVSKDSLSEFKDTCFSIGGPNGGNPLYGSWQYALAIRDTCGNMSALSPYHSTTFVSENGPNFSWTPYIDSGYTALPTGYSFLRDDNNTGNFHVLANLGHTATSTTDPNYASYPNGNWRIDALGFSCNPTYRLAGGFNTNAVFAKSHSNTFKQVGQTTGIFQTSGLNSQISVYPNPANTVLQVSFLGNIESSTLVMTDMLGNTVKKIPFTSQHLTINITDLSEGVYNIIIASNEGTVNKKVVIVR